MKPAATDIASDPRLERLRAIEAKLLEADPADFDRLRDGLAEREEILRSLDEAALSGEGLSESRHAGELLISRLQVFRAALVARLQQQAHERRLADSLPQRDPLRPESAGVDM